MSIAKKDKKESLDDFLKKLRHKADTDPHYGKTDKQVREYIVVKQKELAKLTGEEKDKKESLEDFIKKVRDKIDNDPHYGETDKQVGDFIVNRVKESKDLTGEAKKKAEEDIQNAKDELTKRAAEKDIQNAKDELTKRAKDTTAHAQEDFNQATEYFIIGNYKEAFK